MSFLKLVASLSLTVAAVGCGQSTMMQNQEPAIVYWRDVKPIVDARCTRCHYDGGIAPFALTAYDDVKNNAPLLKVKVMDKTMPPWLATQPCTDYQADRSLTDDQIKTLADWVDLGAPEGDPSVVGMPLPDVGGGLSRVDQNLSLSMPYTPQLSPDEYRCFIVDWPATTTKYITGFRANPGNAKIVHHVIAYLAQPSDVASVQALDDADPAPGYTCFGGPGGSVQTWISGWAPGSMGSDFPPGTGLKIDPGSKVVIQVHYNTLVTAPAPDQTSVDLKIDDTVTKQAYVLPWTNPQWISQQTMNIPAGMADASHTFSFDPSPYMGAITNGVIATNQPFTVYSASVHMHTRGTRGIVDIVRADQSRECMLDVEHWDFHWQGAYGFTTPKVVKPGDQLYLECHWNNTASNQPLGPDGQPLPVTDVNWGEKTTDEMCLGGFYITN
jgi:hypothetical protein